MSEPISKSAIVEFMQIKIARQLKVDKGEVDIHLPLAKLDMDSLAVIGLCNELGEWLNKPVKPTIAWDYPTIDKMANFLAS